MTPEVVFHVAIGVAAILAIGDLLGRLLRRFHLGLVTIEIGVGLLLGHTLLGRVAPGLYSWLFAGAGAQVDAWHAVSQACLFLFMFAAGLDLDLSRMWPRVSLIVLTGSFGTLFPFIAGFSIVLYNPQLWEFPAEFGSFTPALLAGTLFSISALPVILRVLGDLGLQRTEVGTTIVGAAVLDDLIGWSVFGAIIHSISGKFDWFGGHGVLVAFAAGIAFANTRLGKSQSLWRLRVFALRFCTPVYFASMALKIDFAAHWDSALIVILFGFSSFAKVLGVTLAARLSGLAWREALAIAGGLNARGAMCVVLAGIALNSGLLSERLFVAFVSVAVATSFMSGPAMRFLLRPKLATEGSGAGSVLPVHIRGCSE